MSVIVSVSWFRASVPKWNGPFLAKALVTVPHIEDNIAWVIWDAKRCIGRSEPGAQ